MTTRQHADPTTPDEWQAAVDSADFLLLLDSARQYGLVTGGPIVDVARCHEIIRRGADRGVFPGPPGVPQRRLMGRWLREQREIAGLSQAALGRRVSKRQSTIYKIETGVRHVTSDEWAQLRSALLPSDER